MRSRLQWILAAVVTLEFAVIVLLALVLARKVTSVPGERVAHHGVADDADLAGTGTLRAELEASKQRILDLSEQLAAVSEKLSRAHVDSAREGSDVSFSYGTPQQAGRFVGGTIRRLFEIGEKAERGDLQSIGDDAKDLELSIMSLGPFIEEAEAFEADPVVFSRFQSALLGDLLGLGTARQETLDAKLADLKRRASQYTVGSSEWHEINQEGTQAVLSLLTLNERSDLRKRIEFISKSGVLVIPTYSLLSEENGAQPGTTDNPEDVH